MVEKEHSGLSRLAKKALARANAGYPVFPCRPRSKKPATRNGFKDATSDLTIVEQWWRENPEYNLAVACGAAGLLVIDKDSDEADLIWRQWAERFSFEDTYTVLTSTKKPRTKRGEHHWYYDEYELPNAKLVTSDGRRGGEGCKTIIETRGNGGYVLCPGSIHPDTGEVYEKHANSSRDICIVPPQIKLLIDMKIALTVEEAMFWDGTADGLPERCRSKPRKAEKKPSVRVIVPKVWKNHVRDTLEESDLRDDISRSRAIAVALSAEDAKGSSGGEYITYCPVHEALYDCSGIRHKHNPSASVRVENGMVLFKCHGGCDQEEIFAFLKKLGLIRQERREQPTAETAPCSTDWESDAPFSVLGRVSGEKFAFLSDGHVIIKSTQQMTHLGLMCLAPVEWWMNYFREPEGEGLSVTKAASELVRACRRVGTVNLKNLRGFGLWRDGEGFIFNGGGVFVYLQDGSEPAIMDMADYSGEHHYVASGRCISEASVDNPLSDAETERLVAALEMISFENDAQNAAFIGWLGTAPMAGALRWRTHLQICGPQHSGKSQIVVRCAQHLTVSHNAAAGATEAGIRQSIGNDAVAAIYDEAEGMDEKSRAIMASVLTLARAASSGADITKGTPDGRPLQFTARSPFLIAAINSPIMLTQDVTRFVVLNTTRQLPSRSVEVTNALSEAGAFDSEIGERLVARLVMMSPIVIQTVSRVSKACGIALGNSRLGDTFGHVLAGYWHMKFGAREPTPTDIAALTELAKKLAETSRTDEKEDHEQLLDYILTETIPVQLDDRTERVQIGKAVRIVISGRHPDTGEPCGSGPYASALKDHGIQSDSRQTTVYIANSHPALDKMLDQTRWSSPKARRAALLRIMDAKPAGSTKRFGSVVSKSVQVPVPSLSPTVQVPTRTPSSSPTVHQESNLSMNNQEPA